MSTKANPQQDWPPCIMILHTQKIGLCFLIRLSMRLRLDWDPRLSFLSLPPRRPQSQLWRNYAAKDITEGGETGHHPVYSRDWALERGRGLSQEHFGSQTWNSTTVKNADPVSLLNYFRWHFGRPLSLLCISLVSYFTRTRMLSWLTIDDASVMWIFT